MKLVVAGLMSERQNEMFDSLLGWLEPRLEMEFATLALDQEVGGTPDDADLVYLCGLPTSLRLDRLEPLVAPVIPGARYEDSPVYFADIVVAADDPFRQVTDLAGARFAYNEEESFSGWVAPRDGLARLGVAPNSLTWIRTGSHRGSIEAVLEGTADAAAIDSIVLDLEAPTSRLGLRAIAGFGPWPAPPISASFRLDQEIRTRVKGAWSEMHLDSNGRRILSGFSISRLDAVTATRYQDLPRLAAAVNSTVIGNR